MQKREIGWWVVGKTFKINGMCEAVPKLITCHASELGSASLPAVGR
jgi:hypothetical protein